MSDSWADYCRVCGFDDASCQRDVRVTFTWAKKHGQCYNCGLPAAFYLPHAYGHEEEEPSDTNKRCAVCAANAAADGETVERIEGTPS